MSDETGMGYENKMSYIRETCLAFANELADMLEANGKGTAWMSADEAWLAMRCAQEVMELRYALDYTMRAAAEHEALDVGAFAMMVWNNMIRERRHEVDTEADV